MLIPSVRDDSQETRLIVKYRSLGSLVCQDVFDHDKGQKSAISGRRLHWNFLNFLKSILSLLSRFTV